MSKSFIATEKSNRQQLFRYVINGIIATGAHYSVLTFNLKVVGFQSAGVANLVAAIFGISMSFLGSRYYVFCKTEQHMVHQATKFILLYAAIALLHGFVLFLWTDNWHWDYRVGFLVATGFQVMLSYWGNKFLVFKE